MPNNEDKKNGKRKISIFEYLVVGAGAVAIWEVAKGFGGGQPRGPRRYRDDPPADEFGELE